MQDQPQPQARKTLEFVHRGHSRFAEPLLGRTSLTGILDGAPEVFKRTARDLRRRVADAVESASRFHRDLIRLELEGARAGAEAGREPRHSLHGFEAPPEVEQKRDQLRQRFAALQEQLQASRGEVQAQSNLLPEDWRRAAEFLEKEAARCDEEGELLARDSALRDVPGALVLALVALASNSDAATTPWYGGFSPMHWCALHGRRDIIEFIHRLPGGVGMVNSRDLHGRTPRYYAERERSRGHKRSGLIHYLWEDLGATSSPCQPTVQRPRDLGMLEGDNHYKLDILATVETEGWHAVKWRDSYTMLHWAAEKGHRELCEYLIRIGADASTRDNRARTPLDCASGAKHADIARLIEEFMQDPNEWVSLTAFQ